MTAFRASMIRLLRHPSASMIGIIVTFLVALLTLIPAADEYSVLREQTEEAARLVRQGTRDRDGFSQIRETYEMIQMELEAHRLRTIDEDAAHSVRESLVEFARGTNCHLRRVDLGPARIRQWYEKDHPTQSVATSSRGEKTDFQLEVRELRLTLTADIQQVEQFLDKVDALDVQMNIQQLNIKAIDPNGDQVQLELILQLFGIRRATKDEMLKS